MHIFWSQLTLCQGFRIRCCSHCAGVVPDQVRCALPLSSLCIQLNWCTQASPEAINTRTPASRFIWHESSFRQEKASSTATKFRPLKFRLWRAPNGLVAVRQLWIPITRRRRGSWTAHILPKAWIVVYNGLWTLRLLSEQKSRTFSRSQHDGSWNNLIYDASARDQDGCSFSTALAVDQGPPSWVPCSNAQSRSLNCTIATKTLWSCLTTSSSALT